MLTPTERTTKQSYQVRINNEDFNTTASSIGQALRIVGDLLLTESDIITICLKETDAESD